MIIGLNGRMRSGKNTTAQILSENFQNVEEVAFADKLKDSAAASLGISRELLEELKLAEREHVQLVSNPHVIDFNIRLYLQRYGTEAHRDIFGDDFWIEQTLDNRPESENILVVTDMRFPNELSAIIDRGGIAVKIRRKEADDRPITHPSEQTLPDEHFDYFLDNNGTPQELEYNTLEMVQWIEENRPQFRFEPTHIGVS